MREPTEPSLTWQEPLFDLLETFLLHKKKIILIVLLGTSLGVLRFTMMDKEYKSSAVAVLLSRDKPIVDAVVDSASVETSDNSAARSPAGVLMLPPNPVLYATLIQSRSVINAIAEKFSDELGSHLSENDRSEEIYRTLQSMISVSTTDEGLITVSVTTDTPQLSADIANALFDECQRASKDIERQLLLQQAGHLANALTKASERLLKTEQDLQEFSANNQVIDAPLQANNRLRNNREMESRKEILQEELSALLLSYTEKSSEVQSVRAKLQAIDEQLASSKQNIIQTTENQSFAEIKIRLEGLQQKVQFDRDLLLTLSTKADIYRIRAEQPIGDIAIIRSAYPSSRPAGPSKKKEIGLAIGLSMVFALGLAIMIEQWKSFMQHPDFAARISNARKLLISKK